MFVVQVVANLAVVCFTFPSFKIDFVVHFKINFERSLHFTSFKIAIAHGSVEFCEATPIGLADKSKKSLYGRETDRDLRSA